MAAYLEGSSGLSQVNQDAFANGGGTSTIFNKSGVDYNFSAELGYQYSLGPFKFRLGVEALRPKTVQIKGNNSSGVELYSLESSIFVFTPNLSTMYIYSASKTVQFFCFISGGYSSVAVKNEFTLTSTGQTTYSGVSDHSEKMSAKAISARTGFGFETQFADNSTISMSFGYRYLPVKEMKYTTGTTTFAEGAVSAGDVVHNQGNLTRTIDLSGLYLGASFQFYF
ncbi:MAG: hypothetical protein K1X29_04585 [Bdellovibrionales bacterium]|nr:hypothetical protein [Bdellovibrionales bacterium]